jgi:prepilin-type N-terminal cleavage/methylation domain-containing protein
MSTQTTNRRRPMRRAFTLIEMIVAISVAATLTGIAMCLLLVMYRAERSGRTHLAETESLERLADQFRQDVHAAVGDVLLDAKMQPQQWRLELPGKIDVQYDVAVNAVSREERSGSKTVRRESYILPNDSTVSVAVDRKANPPIVCLKIEPSDPSLRPGNPFRVEAVLGRDLRFAQPRKEGK